VLEVLEEHGLAPSAIAGTSIGALMGALWLTSGSAEEAIDALQAFVHSDDYHRAEIEFLSRTKESRSSGWSSLMMRMMRQGVFLGRTIRNPSFVSEASYRHNIEHLVPDVLIEDLPMPFCAVAADLCSGEPVVFRRGSLRDAVCASGAVPGVMPAQELGERVLSDGALVDKVPVRALLDGSVDSIVGVDVSTELTRVDEFDRGVDVISRANQVTEWNLRHARKAICDVVIRPEVQDMNWMDFAAARSAIPRGREATEAVLGSIRGAVRRSRFGRPFGASRAQKAARLYRSGWFGPPLQEG